MKNNKELKPTNCPNCGMPLNPLGDCEYCGTHVRLTNEFDIDFVENRSIDLTLNIKTGEREWSIIPLKGWINQIEFATQYYAINFEREQRIRFEFDGYIKEKDRC